MKIGTNVGRMLRREAGAPVFFVSENVVLSIIFIKKSNESHMVWTIKEMYTYFGQRMFHHSTESGASQWSDSAPARPEKR